MTSLEIERKLILQGYRLIGGIDEVTVIDEASEDRLEKSWKTFLDLGGWKGKRPQNDTRKKETKK